MPGPQKPTMENLHELVKQDFYRSDTSANQRNLVISSNPVVGFHRDDQFVVSDDYGGILGCFHFISASFERYIHLCTSANKRTHKRYTTTHLNSVKSQWQCDKSGFRYERCGRCGRHSGGRWDTRQAVCRSWCTTPCDRTRAAGSWWRRSCTPYTGHRLSPRRARHRLQSVKTRCTVSTANCTKKNMTDSDIHSLTHSLSLSLPLSPFPPSPSVSLSRLQLLGLFSTPVKLNSRSLHTKLRNLHSCCSNSFTGQIPFQTPNRYCQSSKGNSENNRWQTHGR